MSKKNEKVDLNKVDMSFIVGSPTIKQRENEPSPLPRASVLKSEDEEMKEKLSGIDANSVIKSFKNKERRNNPNSAPNPLYPPKEDNSIKSDVVNVATKADVANNAKATTPDIEGSNRISTKRRKLAFEEYQRQFLITPKITNRKPVFISEEARERLSWIANKLGDKNMSASGLVENMVRLHLETYDEDIEAWRKL